MRASSIHQQPRQNRVRPDDGWLGRVFGAATDRHSPLIDVSKHDRGGGGPAWREKEGKFARDEDACDGWCSTLLRFNPCPEWRKRRFRRICDSCGGRIMRVCGLKKKKLTEKLGDRFYFTWLKKGENFRNCFEISPPLISLPHEKRAPQASYWRM